MATPQTIPNLFTRPDRRRIRWREVSLAARIQCRGAPEWADCRVIDISPYGAMLQLAAPMIATREIRVLVPDHRFETIGELRHQDGRTIGIEFTSSRQEALARYG